MHTGRPAECMVAYNMPQLGHPQSTSGVICCTAPATEPAIVLHAVAVINSVTKGAPSQQSVQPVRVR